jgi:predicted glycosyltransferase
MNDHVIELYQESKFDMASQTIEAEHILFLLVIVSIIILSALVAGHKLLFPLAAKMFLPSVSPSSHRRNA